MRFLDGQTVAFGRVIEGYKIFKAIEKMPTENESPVMPVQIKEAGLYKVL